MVDPVASVEMVAMSRRDRTFEEALWWVMILVAIVAATFFIERWLERGCRKDCLDEGAEWSTLTEGRCWCGNGAGPGQKLWLQ